MFLLSLVGLSSARYLSHLHVGTLLGQILVKPAIRFGPTCIFNEAGHLKVHTKVVYDLVAVSVDDAGRQREKGGELARVQLSTGPGPIALEVADAGGGCYRIKFAVQVSGEYRAMVSIDGRPVAGSPITLIAPRGESPRAARPVTGVGSATGFTHSSSSGVIGSSGSGSSQGNTPRSATSSSGNAPRSATSSSGNAPRSAISSSGNTPRSAISSSGNTPRSAISSSGAAQGNAPRSASPGRRGPLHSSARSPRRPAACGSATVVPVLGKPRIGPTACAPSPHSGADDAAVPVLGKSQVPESTGPVPPLAGVMPASAPPVDADDH